MVEFAPRCSERLGIPLWSDDEVPGAHGFLESSAILQLCTTLGTNSPAERSCELARGSTAQLARVSSRVTVHVVSSCGQYTIASELSAEYNGIRSYEARGYSPHSAEHGNIIYVRFTLYDRRTFGSALPGSGPRGVTGVWCDEYCTDGARYRPNTLSILCTVPQDATRPTNTQRYRTVLKN